MEQPSEHTSEQKQAGAATSRRPDPAFSYIMNMLVKRLKLETLDTKLPQTLIADSIIAVPTERELELKATILDFLRDINIFEFKGEHDTFDETEFIKNRVRTDLIFLENEAATFENLLNVIVTARWPTRFFSYMLERGYKFEPVLGRSWLRRCYIGLQEVVIVICNLLPVEPKYADWLIFSPTDQPKWREAVRMFARERNWRLLDMAKGLSLKEYNAMIPELREIFSHYNSEDVERMRAERREILEVMLPDMKQDDPEGLREALTKLEPQERLAGLGPEERLAGLGPEERLAGLEPEERQKLLKLLLKQTQEQNNSQN